ncbi:alpha/beta fold hydrolase [Marinicauda algicola]|uniref:Proline iminopeptidase n=1 Tax=Marinicauda algicola TaxID=2029849 RepID=A0A4S2H342_9PROT|nr:alpha/beta fold hydrolase [Marinicauda algicola]TGY89761.1 alpha/beta fold hydrolase [Marinicauda algicola]
MSALYPEIEPFATGRLPVGGGHELHYEQSGNREGRPVLFLHGGPGSGSSPRHRRYYDPEVWRIVQLDQRGCGRSTPLFSLKDNTTPDLIADLEALRAHLGLERWTVFGPSWGSTLGLAYAQACPDRVEALVVEGVFLATREELDWWHAPAGAGRIHPEALGALMTGVPEALHEDPPAFMAWAREEMARELEAGAPILDDLADPAAPLSRLQESLVYRWSAYEETLSWMAVTPEEIRTGFAAKGRDWLIAHSLIEAHYFSNACFLGEGQLLGNAAKLAMPVHIVQSRYDLVCPPRAAARLARAVAHAVLHLVPEGGHAMTEPAHRRVRAVFEQLARG